jgi:diguanylate cyclase (GGDEF)-like protein
VTSADDAGPPTAAVLEAVKRSMPVAVLQLDLEGVVRAAMGGSLAFPPEELVGRSLVELAETPESRDLLQRALAGTATGGVASWGGRWWQTRYEPLRDDEVAVGVIAVYVDVTEQVAAHAAREQAAVQFRAVLDAAGEAIAVTDVSGDVSWTNSPCARLLAQPELAEQLRGPVRQVVAEALATTAFDDGGRSRRELELRVGKAGRLWLLASARAMASSNGEPLGAVVVLTDITTNKAVESRLETAALTDALTGAASRAKLLDRLEHALQHRTAGSVGVLFCDVDELKAVNDRLGHAAGDALLRAVAERIRSVLRTEDTLGRHGGDEFVVLTGSLHGPDDLVLLGERVRTAVCVPLRLGAETVTPTVSIGAATAPPYGSAGDLLHAADTAAYAAKAAGRNTVRQAGPAGSAQ